MIQKKEENLIEKEEKENCTRKEKRENDRLSG